MENFRNVNKRVSSIEISERLLVLCLKCVVKFLAQTILDFSDHVFGIQTFETKRKESAQQVGSADVGINRLSNAGILHLDCHGTFACWCAKNCAVYLTNGGSGNGLIVKLNKHLIDGTTHFGF